MEKNLTPSELRQRLRYLGSVVLTDRGVFSLGVDPSHMMEQAMYRACHIHGDQRGECTSQDPNDCRGWAVSRYHGDVIHVPIEWLDDHNGRCICPYCGWTMQVWRDEPNTFWADTYSGDFCEHVGERVNESSFLYQWGGAE